MAKVELSFSSPILNAAGFLGFAPNPRGPIDIDSLGGFFTNPVSLEPRSPAHRERCLEYPGGFLLHTGHPNPGIRKTLRQFRGGWERFAAGVWVHLLVKGVEDTRRLVRILEEREGVMGVEIGLPPGIDEPGASALLQAAQGELPVIVRLPLEQVSKLAATAIRSGAAAISLGAPRGCLPGTGNQRIHGRLYGPAIFPQALQAVQECVTQGIPVIGAGGIYQAQQAQVMLAAGALAVQLDAILWRGGWIETPSPNHQVQ